MGKNIIFPKPIKKKRKWNYFIYGKNGNKKLIIVQEDIVSDIKSNIV